MAAYYNEINPFSAQWLRNLIKAGVIADGEVDERSIEDVLPNELAGFTQCHFFAGIGGWSYALRRSGWADDRKVWTGSCPCQPFSSAGKGVGLTDERHLWPALFHLIEQAGPGVFFGEQVEAATKHGWLDLVRSDLEGIGYSFAPVGLPAACVGALHNRPRTWFVADTFGDKQSRKESRNGKNGRMGRKQQPFPWNRDWESTLREFRALDDGLHYGVEAVDAPRNAIVPQVAQAFIESYMSI